MELTGNKLSQTVWQRPALGTILPDVLAFALGLGIAWKLHWKTTNLVWSLWLGSLVLGYLTILSIIGGWVYIGIRLLCYKDFPRGYRLKDTLIGSVAVLFILGFFSLHFCGFHAGHANFLDAFFPVAGLPKNAFLDAFMNPVLLWKTVFQHFLFVYGAFLVPAIIAERTYIFGPFITAVRAVRAGARKHMGVDLTQFGNAEQSLKATFTRPYINVIRMHLLIFFFGFCYVLKIESFFVYSVVYLVYFFPWKAFRHSGAAPRDKSSGSAAALP